VADRVDQSRIERIGTVLRGKTLAIWGYGKIGRMIAGYGKAFGMRVLVWGGDKSRQAAAADGFEAAASREAFFAEADVLSLHLRLVDATRAIVTAEDLARMKPTALFVNTSRAELVAEGALEAALVQGRPGQAALDVFASEPLAAGRRSCDTDRAGHAAPGVRREGQLRVVFRGGVQECGGFAAGKPSNILNPEALG
jgi:D-3-phosphoglycerate dehydrogenase